MPAGPHRAVRTDAHVLTALSITHVEPSILQRLVDHGHWPTPGGVDGVVEPLDTIASEESDQQLATRAQCGEQLAEHARKLGGGEMDQ